MFTEDIPSPSGVLTDEDAAAIRAAGGPAAAPPHLRDFYAAQLNQYDAFRVSAPRQVDLQERARQEKVLQDLTLDFDKTTEGQDLASIRLAPDEQTRNAAKDSLTVDAYIQAHTKPMAFAYKGATREMIRDAVAVSKFGEGKGTGSDGAFVAEAKVYQTKRRDLESQTQHYADAGIEDALTMEPEDFMKRAERLTDIFKSDSTVGPEDAKKLRETYLLSRQQAEGKLAPLRPVAKEVYDLLATGKTERFGDAAQANIEGAIDKLAELPTDQRGFVVSLLKSVAPADSGGNAIEKGASAFVRGLVGQLRGYASNSQRMGLMGGMNELQSTGTVDAELDTPEKIAQRIATGQPLASDLAGDISGLIAKPSRKITPEEQAKVQALVDKQMTRNAVAGQAIGILEGTIDPIKSDGVLQDLATGVGSSLGAMSPMIIPYAGVFIAQGGYADEEYQRLLSIGVDQHTAHGAAQITGAVQAAVERVAFLFNFVPKSALGKLSAKLAITDPILLAGKAGMAFGIAGKAATTTAFEYAEEIEQAAAPAFTAAIAPALGLNLPEQAQFTAELQRFKGDGDLGGLWRPDVYAVVAALTLLPASIHGAHATVEARAVLTAKLADPDYAKAMGIKQEQAIVIAAMPARERLGAYLESFPNRDTSTPVAKAAAAAVVTKAQAAAQQGQQEITEAEAAGVTIKRTAEGWDVVDEADGTTLSHATAEEATATMRHVMESRGMQREDTFLNAVDEFATKMQPGRTIQLSEKSGNLLKELEDASTAGRNNDVQAIWDRADEYRASRGEAALDRDKENPDSRDALEGLMVLGRSSTEAKGNAARSISLIMREGRTLDLVEEQAENDLRKAVGSGSTTMATMNGIIDRIEAVTGDKYRFKLGDVGTTEAWSRLVRLYTTGTRKGNKITAGARAEMASDFRAERQRLRKAEGQGIAPAAFAKMREYLDYLKSIMGQVSRLMKAKADGKLDDLEAMIRESVGLKEQDVHEQTVVDDTHAKYNLPADPADPMTGVGANGYSITTADRLSNVADRLASKARDPDVRFRMYETARERMAGMSRSVAYNDSVFPQTDENAKRRDMLRFLSALDTILMPFPAEVRGKVGGFVKLASLRTNRQMETYLKDRVEKLDKVLETHMRKEYTEAMNRLLKKAEPVKGKPGEKMAGKLGPDVQHLMDTVKQSLAWTADEVNGRIAELQSKIDGGNLTAEQEALALREIELVQLTGDWNHSDAAKRSAALKAATETYEGGYLEWKNKLIAKRERRAAVKTALIVDTGKAGTLEERNARAEKDLGWWGKTKDFFLSLSSFDEVTRYVFGHESAAARELVDAERAAAYAYEDGRDAMADAVLSHFRSLSKGSHLGGEKLRYRLAQKTIEANGVKLSEMEAIQALLMWNQEDGKRHMEGPKDENNQPVGPWNYDQAWIDDVASQMSPEGKATMAFIQRTYAGEWATLNPLYRERHGVNLPRHANYAPITVAPVQAKGGEMVDPVSGNAIAGSILTPGSLRTRSRSAIAEPEFRDALQTLIAHHAQMEHWKAYYDFAVEAQAVLGNREVGNSVKAAAGAQGNLVLRKWIDLFSQGGSRDAGAALAANRGLSTVSGRAARMALIGRMGTLMIQSTQLGAAIAEMPTGAYIARLGKLLSGNLGWSDAIRSEFIQRRISEMPPIVRQAMAGLDTDKPNAIKHAVARLGTLISGADGLFTAGTYAMLLDYHRSQAAKQGFTGPEADAYAHAEAARATERVAQPTRAGTRSLFENTTTSPIARLGWAFASEARQKIALAAWAGSDIKSNPSRAARVAFLTWGVGGLMAQIIRNAWRDAKDDDDDELFDDRNWSLKQLAASTIAGPLQGIPGFGEALQSLVASATGTYDQSGNLLSSLGRSVPAVKHLATGDFLDSPEPLEETMKDVESVLTAAGLANDTIAATTSLMHVIRDGAALMDGMHDDPQEAGTKQLAKEKKAAEAAKPKPTPEQEAAHKAALKAKKDAEIKAAAKRANQ